MADAKRSKALDEQRRRLAANVSKQPPEIERLKTLLDKKQPEAATMASTAPSPAALDLPLVINEPSQLAPTLCRFYNAEHDREE
jgi:hypothetical protein